MRALVEAAAVHEVITHRDAHQEQPSGCSRVRFLGRGRV